MHWPSNLGEWGFWISLLAFTLGFPLSILANICSPWLKNWWAQKSVATLRKRLAQLTKELRHIEKGPLFPPLWDFILPLAGAFMMFLCSVFQAFFALALYFAELLPADKRPMAKLAATEALK